jgi:transcriptional regulator with XRE-family HTH domain
MKLNIGENIKNLRKTKNITQEELAEILGGSFQSVSRWENETCYPDMELLPMIADYFGVTVDRLIGADKTVEQMHVKQYLDRFQAALSRGRVDDCIEIARAGVAEYPNNYALLNKLMYALFLATDGDGNIPDWEDSRKKFDAEILRDKGLVAGEYDPIRNTPEFKKIVDAL